MQKILSFEQLPQPYKCCLCYDVLIGWTNALVRHICLSLKRSLNWKLFMLLSSCRKLLMMLSCNLFLRYCQNWNATLKSWIRAPKKIWFNWLEDGKIVLDQNSDAKKILAIPQKLIILAIIAKLCYSGKTVSFEVGEHFRSVRWEHLQKKLRRIAQNMKWNLIWEKNGRRFVNEIWSCSFTASVVVISFSIMLGVTKSVVYHLPRVLRSRPASPSPWTCWGCCELCIPFWPSHLQLFQPKVAKNELTAHHLNFVQWKPSSTHKQLLVKLSLLLAGRN